MDAVFTELAVVAANAEESAAAPDGQIEIPFVPAAQRQTVPLAEVPMDTIVVVGQRQKKRKRDRAPKLAATTVAAAPSDADAAPADADIEEFDYSSAPNILDAGAALLAGAAGTQKRRRKHEQAPVARSDFPSAPRAPADVKSGNRSYTYK
jgi:exosome complex exonuclease RRP6